MEVEDWRPRGEEEFMPMEPQGRKRKNRYEEDAISYTEPNEWLLSKVSKKYRDSSPLALSELLENCSIDRGKEEMSSDFLEEDAISVDKDAENDWMRTYMNLKFILSRVDTDSITNTIKRDLSQYPELQTPIGFHNYYKALFAHWCAGNCSRRLGNIYIGIAIHLWLLLMKERCFFFDVWVAYLVEREIQYISRDQWNLFFEFCQEFQTIGFGSYDCKNAWPTLMDEFVAFYKENHSN
eukprot:TRINITY_DN4469_c0_g1_i1.p1 TRINITY_DN4469_c0_g1~~TRINITY_DN4469_c0_g1_i1.p1  ORF type:complete len:238 (+),score=63.53 TRINITY_DN4469_c0_g1_i1:36-749(+)